MARTNMKAPKMLRRMKKVVSSNMTKPAIRRLARRGGVKRLGSNVYGEANAVLRAILQDAIESAVAFVEHARRKTLTVQDVLYAMERKGKTLYM